MRHAEACFHTSLSGRRDVKVMDPPLGINHSRFGEGTSTDGEHGKDQAEKGGRPESEEVENLGPGSFL